MDMMKYLQDHIIDELKGSVDYAEKAVATKGTKDGVMFCKMSKMEADHANVLYRMFNEHAHSGDVSDSDYATASKAIVTAYETYMPKLDVQKKLYYEK